MATAKHYAHLTFEMRREIENGVVEGRSPAWMAEGLGVDATSVSRELRPTARSGTTAPTGRPARGGEYATPTTGGSAPHARGCAGGRGARTTSASGVGARIGRHGPATAARGARPAPWSSSPTRPGWRRPRPTSASRSRGGAWT